jgi:hypothetical protein
MSRRIALISRINRPVQGHFSMSVAYNTDLIPVEDAHDERRGQRRQLTLKRAQLIHRNGHCVVECTIFNLSDAGAKVATLGWQDLPQHLVLRVEGGPTHTCDVVWHANEEVGLVFDKATMKVVPPPPPLPPAPSADRNRKLLGRIADIERQLAELKSEIAAG